MAKGYRPVRRDQVFLLPEDMRDWLGDKHFVWLVLDLIDTIDTMVFHGGRPGRANRFSTAGQRGYDPDMLLGLLIYGYAVGQRSSRQIERLCGTDAAFRVLCAGDVPDHTVLSRFQQRHNTAFKDFFAQVLAMCVASGMGRFGVVALDGTKIAANASREANRSEAALRKMELVKFSV